MKKLRSYRIAFFLIISYIGVTLINLGGRMIQYLHDVPILGVLLILFITLIVFEAGFMVGSDRAFAHKKTLDKSKNSWDTGENSGTGGRL